MTGLSAGWKLAEAGYAVRVVEKDSGIGGMSATFRQGDYELDYGPHKIFTVLEDVHREIQGLFSEGELLRIKKRSRVRLRGRYLNFPLGLMDIFLGLGVFKGLQCGVGYLLSVLGGQGKNRELRTYQDWVVAKFGRPIYELVLGPYAAKIWGPPETLARELAASRIAAPNLMEMVRQMIFGLRKNSPVIHAEEFQYPKHGAQEISDKMAGKIRAQGGQVVCSRSLQAIVLGREGRVSQLVYADGSRDTLTPQAVCISTMPLERLSAALGKGLPQAAQAAIQALKTRNLILLYVVLPQDRLIPDNWLFFPEKKYPFNRIFEQKAFSPFMVPEGKTVLCVEITCGDQDELWQATDAEVFARLRPQLQEVGLLPGEPLETFVRRLTHAYPVYDLAYADHLARALAEINRIGNLYTVGRQGGFSYTGMADSMDIGFKTAAFISQGKDKSGDWIAYGRQFYNYVVVD